MQVVAPVDSRCLVDSCPAGDGVLLQILAPQEGDGEHLGQSEVVAGEPRPVPDGTLLAAALLWTPPSYDKSVKGWYTNTSNLYPSTFASVVASHLMSPPQPWNVMLRAHNPTSLHHSIVVSWSMRTSRTSLSYVHGDRPMPNGPCTRPTCTTAAVAISLCINTRFESVCTYIVCVWL